MTAVVFVADPLELADPSIDTTVGLIRAAWDRDLDVWCTEAARLEAVDGRARAQARRIVPGDDAWFRASAVRPLWLDTAEAVFLRTEPPMDEVFTTATLVLDLVDPARTVLVNDPRGLRACSEHLFPLRFGDLILPTVVTADERTIRAFLAEHGSAVAKPVDGFSGRGVLRLERHDPNLPSLLELCTDLGRRPVVVQRFLREVAEGNKRVFVVDGEPVAAVTRYPVPGDFRIKDPARSPS